MKGFKSGSNFHTSANSGFSGSSGAPKTNFATGGMVGKPAGIMGGMLGKAAAKMSPKAQSAKAGQLNNIANQISKKVSSAQPVAAGRAPVTPAPAPAMAAAPAAPPQTRAYKKGGKVEAGAGSGVYRMQVQESGKQ